MQSLLSHYVFYFEENDSFDSTCMSRLFFKNRAVLVCLELFDAWTRDSLVLLRRLSLLIHRQMNLWCFEVVSLILARFMLSGPCKAATRLWSFPFLHLHELQPRLSNRFVRQLGQLIGRSLDLMYATVARAYLRHIHQRLIAVCLLREGLSTLFKRGSRTGKH